MGRVQRANTNDNFNAKILIYMRLGVQCVANGYTSEHASTRTGGALQIQKMLCYKDLYFLLGNGQCSRCSVDGTQSGEPVGSKCAL